MLQAHPVQAFSDNYIWLLEAGAERAFVVDPGDAAPVLLALKARGLALAGILVTHHHPDHVGGVAELLRRCGPVPVYGPRGSPASDITHPLDDGDRISVLDFAADVLAVPGGQLAGFVLVAGLVGVLAALWPGRRAARLDVLRAIATD